MVLRFEMIGPRPLRYSFVALLLLLLLAFTHVIFLQFQPERRRHLRFPPLPPDASPLPPLALVEDLGALADFFVLSLDDATEDLAKLGCLAITYSLGWRLSGGSRGFALARVGGLTAAVSAYTLCDEVSDAAGDVVAEAVASVARLFGYEPPQPEPELPPSTSFLARFADDAAEDAFKALCLYSHAKVGLTISHNVLGRHSAYLGGYAPLFGSLIALGVPAAKYNLCNSYGDYVGDWTQYHVEALAQLLTRGSVTASRLTPRTSSRRSRLSMLRPSANEKAAPTNSMDSVQPPADAQGEGLLGQADVDAVVNAVAEAMGAGQALDVVDANADSDRR